MKSDSILFLSAADVRRALPMREAVEAMKSAFATLSAGKAVVPLRTHVEMPENDGILLLMPCYLPSAGALSLKAITLFGGNPGRGLPRIQALVTLYDGETGQPQAILDGASLTALRTGGASGVATDLMARPDASTVAVFGAGVQARTQLEAVCAVRPIRAARVFDARAEAAVAFSREMSTALRIDVQASSSAKEALHDAAIVCAASTSATPVFDDADLAPGTHINAVGSYQPAVQEIPTGTVLRARVVVDHRESALAETGDLLIPIGQGLFSAGRIAAEIGELVVKAKPGRTSADEITLFKSVGVAIQDLAAAACAVKNARVMGIGTQVAL